MRRCVRRLALLASSLALATPGLLAGCQGFAGTRSAAGAGAAGQEARDPWQPAVLVAPADATANAALQAALQRLVGQRRLTLAPGAFFDSSELVLERERPPGPSGRLATGRELEPPILVRLRWRAGRCALERGDHAAHRVEVEGLRCRPLAVDAKRPDRS
ncbi:MAG: hypothetical protein IT481_12125 [Gammaproteobacteria bacterium]|nr:hypothetical protein [Gammaproteobacteria bacterium]